MKARAPHASVDTPCVDLLLTYALDAVDAGRLDFRRRAVAWVIERGRRSGMTAIWKTFCYDRRGWQSLTDRRYVVGGLGFS